MAKNCEGILDSASTTTEISSAHTENERTVTAMAEYIKREAAIAAIMSEPPDAHYPHWYVDKIESIPAADVEPVRHGRWVSVPHKLAIVCSVCNRDEPYKFADIDADVYDYCPNCGARMDEEVKHER